MIVADTSALISLSLINLLKTANENFNIYTTSTVIEELQELEEDKDEPAKVAENILQRKQEINIEESNDYERFQSSRIDKGEASCIELTRKEDAKFFLTDDLHALPELRKLSLAEVAISPIFLKSMVKKDLLTNEEAAEKLDELAETRNWLGTPIYRRAKKRLELEE